jgi:hypothetical protein
VLLPVFLQVEAQTRQLILLSQIRLCERSLRRSNRDENESSRVNPLFRDSY